MLSKFAKKPGCLDLGKLRGARFGDDIDPLAPSKVFSLLLLRYLNHSFDCQDALSLRNRAFQNRFTRSRYCQHFVIHSGHPDSFVYLLSSGARRHCGSTQRRTSTGSPSCARASRSSWTSRSALWTSAANRKSRWGIFLRPKSTQSPPPLGMKLCVYLAYYCPLINTSHNLSTTTMNNHNSTAYHLPSGIF